MNPMDLSKKQKQYLVLGIIAFIAISVLIVFGIKVSLTSISEAKLELHGLTEKITAAEKSISKSQQSEAEFDTTIANLKAHLANIPPDRNYYSWATEIIYREARSVQFEIDAIDEMLATSPVKNPSAQKSVILESYALRITAHGRYENVKGFLELIADNHPLVRVTGIEISTGAQPDIHDVQLFIEWPFNMGYITETWKNTPARPASTDLQSIQVGNSGATAATGESSSTQQPASPPSVSNGAMESGMPAAEEMSGADVDNEGQQEEPLKQ